MRQTALQIIWLFSYCLNNGLQPLDDGCGQKSAFENDTRASVSIKTKSSHQIMLSLVPSELYEKNYYSFQ